jgi:membrane protein DedA with SNARE-associated domain
MDFLYHQVRGVFVWAVASTATGWATLGKTLDMVSSSQWDDIGLVAVLGTGFLVSTAALAYFIRQDRKEKAARIKSLEDERAKLRYQLEAEKNRNR